MRGYCRNVTLFPYIYIYPQNWFCIFINLRLYMLYNLLFFCTKRVKEGDLLENIEDLWNSILANIQEKVSKPSFDTWLKSTKAHSLQGDSLVVVLQMNLHVIG